MKITINKKPILVTDEPMRERSFSYVYLLVSTAGYLSLIWLVDYIGYTFINIHPIPLIHKIGEFILCLF